MIISRFARDLEAEDDKRRNLGLGQSRMSNLRCRNCQPRHFDSLTVLSLYIAQPFHEDYPESPPYPKSSMSNFAELHSLDINSVSSTYPEFDSMQYSTSYPLRRGKACAVCR